VHTLDIVPLRSESGNLLQYYMFKSNMADRVPSVMNIGYLKNGAV